MITLTPLDLHFFLFRQRRLVPASGLLDYSAEVIATDRGGPALRIPVLEMQTLPAPGTLDPPLNGDKQLHHRGAPALLPLLLMHAQPPFSCIHSLRYHCVFAFLSRL